MPAIVVQRAGRILKLILAMTLTPVAAAQARLGTVHFPVTCNSGAQEWFDQGMLLQHSFGHDAAHAAFESALQRDATCTIAYWGMALSSLNNPLVMPSQMSLAHASALLDQATGLGSRREADYVAALGILISGPNNQPWAARTSAFAQAMEQLAAHYPDDAEALILYTLALLMAAPPDDLTFAKQRHAAVILEALSERLPDHPGVAHYLIHAYDTPTDAPKGLTAARHYAQIAPDSAHAVHMPSHIFTRVGAWTDSIQSNARSARVAHTENMSNDELHAMDYLVYAYLQTGQTRAARVVQDDARSVADHLDATHLGGPFAAAAIDARLALESGDWSAATALSIRLSQFCYVPAMTHYARALGFARSGNPAAAGPELESLAALAGKLYAANDSYWAGQVEIQLVASAAWVAFASGRHEEGLAQMRAAAEMESATNKNVVTPGPLLPARELLAEMLLDVDRPTEAHTQFAKVLEVEPDRFRSLFGAGRAAELAGDLVGAKLRYARLLQIAANADTHRLELQQARAFLAANCPCVRQ